MSLSALLVLRQGGIRLTPALGEPFGFAGSPPGRHSADAGARRAFSALLVLRQGGIRLTPALGEPFGFAGSPPGRHSADAGARHFPDLPVSISMNSQCFHNDSNISLSDNSDESFQSDQLHPMQSTAIGKSDEDHPMQIWQRYSQIPLSPT